MASSSQQVIWETWNRQPRDPLASRAELVQMALQLGANPKGAIDQLVRRRLVIPLFRGYYYVRTPNEVLLGETRYDPVQLFAMAAERGRLGGWYFGLDSALHIQGLSQEFAKMEQVVSAQVQRSDPVEIEGRGFKIHRWAAAPQSPRSGIRVIVSGAPAVRMRVSDPARTLVDFLYRDYWAQRRGSPTNRRWKDLRRRLDDAEVRDRLQHFRDAGFLDWAHAQLGG